MKTLKTSFIFALLLATAATALLNAQPLKHTIDGSYGITVSHYDAFKGTTQSTPIYGWYADRGFHTQTIYKLDWVYNMTYSRISKITYYVNTVDNGDNNHSDADYNYNINAVVKVVEVPVTAKLSDGFIDVSKLPAATYTGNLSYSNGVMEFTFNPPLRYMGDKSLLIDVAVKEKGPQYSTHFIGGTMHDDGSSDPTNQDWKKDPRYGISRYSYGDKQIGATIERGQDRLSWFFPKITFTYTPFVTYEISASAGSNGSITPIGDTVIEEGLDCTYKFKADIGYRIAKVWIDDTNNPEAVSSGIYTFKNLQADHTIRAEFERIPYDITTTVTSGNGTIIHPNGTTGSKYTALHGDSARFTFTPNEGYKISQIRIDGYVNNTPISTGYYTFKNITANHSISATFVLKEYNIVPSVSSGHGTITPSNTLTLKHFSNQRFDFKPDTGYKIAQVLIDGVNNPEAVAKGYYEFKSLSAPHTIDIIFEILKFQITASIEGANGLISPAGNSIVEFGSSQMYVIVSNNGFSISKLLVDGTEQPDAFAERFYAHTFHNVREEHTIKASFGPMINKDSFLIATLRNDTANLHDIIEALQNDTANLNAIIAESLPCDTIKCDTTDFYAIITALQNDTAILHETVEILQSDTAILHTTIVILQADTARLHEIIMALRNNTDNLNTTTGVLKTQNHALSADNSELTSDTLRLYDMVITLELENEILKDSIFLLQGNIIHLEDNIAQSQDSIVKLLQMLADCANGDVANANSILQEQINTYPNPVTDKLHIETDQIIKEIVVMDLQGRVLMRQQGNKHAIDLQSLQFGNYIVTIRTENAIIPVKILKN
ncbi:MAG: T9SS type A sorting domain-containing protein [Bacteroidales bacterium]|jgi:hypothetical protein|nr:T9SS type A sorting domain-containing protein [Bacteroidales bacterium]